MGTRKHRKSKRHTRKNHRNLGGKKSKRKTRTTRSKRQRGGGEQEDNLFKAATDNNLDKAREALEKGADVNAKNKVIYQADNTALMLASRHAHPEMVKYLLQNGADVNAKSTNGSTALSWASALRAKYHDQRKVPYIEIEKLLKQYIVKETLPKHFERQQNRLNVGRVMDSKKMPGDLTHKIITEHFGGKRKTRKSKPKKRNRRSRKRAGANGDDSYDEGVTDRESISQDEPFHVDDIDAIPLADELHELHELEMANLDDSWASHSSFNPDESLSSFNTNNLNSSFNTNESLSSINVTN